MLSILRGSQARIVVPSARISPWLKHSIVAIEDKRFYEHRGVDVRGMARALYADISNRGTVQGGSTITQQFVKNAYLSNQQTVGRKLIEAALAWQLEQKWSKDKILTAYLNTVYFGNGAYGVEQASKIYFHHHANPMKPAEAALLAGIPEDPSLWDPVAHPQAAKARRNLVLKQLYTQGYLTKSQYVNSLVYPMPDPAKVNLPSTQGVAAPYFANYVKDQLVHTLGPSHLTKAVRSEERRVEKEGRSRKLPDHQQKRCCWSVDGDDHRKLAPSPVISSTKFGKLVAIMEVSSTVTGEVAPRPSMRKAMAMR